ncbi:MAG: WXG100 family type VII secretion target [Oscillospiraceae bacterium]|jgi:WXG100 family type VII secretion target|nr:WXG100 family type VII secretion target [Oscillospiraceae bacterium]
MSSTIIKLDEAEIDKANTAMTAALESMRNLLTTMHSINSDLISKWEGQSGNSFASVSEELANKFAKLNKGLNRMTDEVVQAYQEFIAMDESLSAVTAGASIGTAGSDE